ncbi:MAG: methyltransferase domain-containing protein [Brevefilum sp.]|nr:methyltransferase domain-containing protein [Brevefilum sp.]
MGTDPSMPDNIILSHYHIEPLTIRDMSTTSLSLDLGKSSVVVHREGANWVLPDGQVLRPAHLEAITADKNGCFLFTDGELEKIQAYSPRTDRYYSLMPTPSAPTMLISGIPMHRIKDTTPLEDTRHKLKALGKPSGRVLDTATGLGYTAIQAARSAALVVTVEFDPAVLDICRRNPWSADLFTSPNIQPLIGDSADLVPTFPDECFDAVIHDPPTFALAGQMYAGEMYRHLYRILKPGGRLFHYIGNPDSRYGATTSRGVVIRLRSAGFRVTPKERAFGVLAVK